MKKSSLVVLTLVAALAMSSCAVQNVPQNIGPPDPVYADNISDTTRQQPAFAPVVQYDYYYRSYFFDDLYRWFFPRQYYTVITRPGFVPRHKRPIRSSRVAVHHSRSMPSSGRRGGFGRTGSLHGVTA
ncbi:MAG TPA: hypothetical protein VKQ08_08760 [Cyclobacteriaceae bacterium]|nr:hypothetical protein [Cyclobacteriaceae bacterium]